MSSYKTEVFNVHASIMRITYGVVDASVKLRPFS
jgi:hypothetical protein